MILADKIIDLRKKNGWSQQELADKMNVSRQSVSKWESAMSVPDLDKILQLGNIFGVSTDYLLKDEMEKEEYSDNTSYAESQPVRRVSLAEANEFLRLKFESAGKIALAVFLCVMSPVCLLILSGVSSTGMLGITENAAVGIGLLVLLIIVTAAVALFITTGMKTSKYEFLDKEPIETEYGVTGVVKEKAAEYNSTYSRYTVTGICVCILSVIPLLTSVFLTEKGIYIILALCATIVTAGIGVVMLVNSGIKHSSFQKLLEEGDYSKNKKARNPVVDAITTVYWLVATAVYLGFGFHDSWSRSWIVWPVSGVIFGAVMAVLSVVNTTKKK